MKKGFHKDGSLGGAVTVLRFGGPAGGEKADGTDAIVEGRGGTVGTFRGSVNTFLGIDASALAGTTPGC